MSKANWLRPAKRDSKSRRNADPNRAPQFPRGRVVDRQTLCRQRETIAPCRRPTSRNGLQGSSTSRAYYVQLTSMVIPKASPGGTTAENTLCGMSYLMQLRDIAQPDSNFFLKSVYGPVGESWPAMSFTLPQLETYLYQNYRPMTDFILLTGTSGEATELQYRGRLLSALIIDRTKSYRTEEIVPSKSWKWAHEKYPGQWEFSFGVLRAWSFVPPPRSVDVVPRSYPLMGRYPHRGMVRQIEPEERELIGSLEITEEPLPLQPTMKPALTLQALQNDKALNQEAVRIADLIFSRVNASGSIETRTAPQRTAPSPSNLLLKVADKLQEQPLCCALCGGRMLLQPENRLLQPSPDRIDSASGSYGPENFQLGHLACNLAKNNAPMTQFREWLNIASARPNAAETEPDIG